MIDGASKKDTIPQLIVDKMSNRSRTPGLETERY
jgi:hypothetical protein